MDKNTTTNIQEFVENACNETIAAVEREYIHEFNVLEAQLTAGPVGCWALYEPITRLFAREKGAVAQAAFLIGLRYGMAMAHISNPSLFTFTTQEPGITQ